MPAPTITRLNTITYGGFVVGGGTDYQITDGQVWERDYFTTVLVFTVFFSDPLATDFENLRTALED